MSSIWKSTASALALAGALLAVNSAQAQTKPATAAAAKPSAPAKQQQQQQQQQQQPVTADSMFARWDKDKNNTLTLTEFKAGWQEVQANMILRQLHDTFVAMDVNKSGALEAAEYANLELVKKAGAGAQPMSTFDTDKNQRLDFNEYIGMIKVMLKPKG